MATTDSTSAFQAMIAHYEASGWEVRMINHTDPRAFVRAGASIVGDGSREVPARTVATPSACRKLWVDSKGEVQETVVPC
jgi:hypothetical protein